MDDEIDSLRRELSEGTRVPSDFSQDFTISVGPASRPPQNGDIWILAGTPYVVSEVSSQRPTASGKLRYVAESLPRRTSGQ